MADFHGLVAPGGLGDFQGDELGHRAVPHVRAVGDDEPVGVLGADGPRQDSHDPGIGGIVHPIGFIQQVEAHFGIRNAFVTPGDKGPMGSANFLGLGIGP